MGASKLLVRFTVRMRACCLSSLEDEIAIWFAGGDWDRTLLMRTPPEGGGDALRFDMTVREEGSKREPQLRDARRLVALSRDWKFADDYGLALWFCV